MAAPLFGAGGADERQEFGKLDHGHAVGAGGADVEVLIAGRNREGERRGVVAVQFVDGDLDDFTESGAEDGERIPEYPAVFHVRQGDQVFRPQLGGDYQAAVIARSRRGKCRRR